MTPRKASVLRLQCLYGSTFGAGSGDGGRKGQYAALCRSSNRDIVFCLFRDDWDLDTRTLLSRLEPKELRFDLAANFDVCCAAESVATAEDEDEDEEEEEEEEEEEFVAVIVVEASSPSL